MTKEGPHEIAEQPGGVRITLRGAYEQATAESLEHECLRWTAAHGTPPKATIVLVELTDFSIYARAPLIRMHKALASAGCRIAYVADRPRFRGVALLVFHLADDPNARAFPTEADAAEWLSSSESRIDERLGRWDAAVSRVKGGAR